MSDKKYAFLVLSPLRGSTTQDSLLDAAFGKPWELTPAKTRVPTYPWAVRTWPSTQPEELQSRTLNPQPADDIFAPKVRELRQGTTVDKVELPPLNVLEDYNDSLAFSDGKEVDRPPNFDLLQAVRSSGGDHPRPAGMLNRTELARLFGVDGWEIDTAHARLVKCTGRCDPLSGFPLAVSYTHLTLPTNREV